MDSQGILIIFLGSFIIIFCFVCLCCSIFSESEEDFRSNGKLSIFRLKVIFHKFSFLSERNIVRPVQRNNEENAFVIQLEEPIKKNVTSPIKTPSSIKSPIKLKSSSIETIPPPSYEEWLQMSTAQLNTNM